MSGLLGSPFGFDRNFIEGLVTWVDSERDFCTVTTVSGKVFNDVTWLRGSGGSDVAGMHFTPDVGNKVLVMTGLTYPIIMGCLPRIGPQKAFSGAVGTTPLGIDPGGSTALKNGFKGNPGKPQDFVAGDSLLANKEGGLVGVLREGTALLRASRLAQVIASKFDDLVRIVARNFHRISDFDESGSFNLKGRLYSYLGFNRDLTKSKLGIYEYEEIQGDVSAGEYGKADPFNAPSPIPAKGTVVIKKRLKKTTGEEVFLETLEEEGKMTVKVTGGKVSTSYQDNEKIEETIDDTSRSTQLSDKIEHSVEDIAVVTITPDSVVVKYSGDVTGTFDGTGINLQAKGHFAIIDAAGVHLG